MLDAKARSASSTALTTVGGAAIVPASPMALMPSGLVVAGISTSSETNSREVSGARHAVVEETSGHQLAGLLVVDDVFEQRLPDALRDAAVNLPLADHRIDDHAEIVDGGETIDADRAGFRIDFDFAHLTAVRIIGRAARHARPRANPIEAETELQDRPRRSKKRAATWPIDIRLSVPITV
jgi:hypothetical protein